MSANPDNVSTAILPENPKSSWARPSRNLAGIVAISLLAPRWVTRGLFIE